jgi:hypothetical protein
MTRARLALRLAAVAAVTLSLGFAPGCGRNGPGTVLAPSILRPGPLVYTGQIKGTVLFDTLATPDLAVAPYPPTRVELYDKQTKPATLLAVETLAPNSRVYTFKRVKPGVDSIYISSPTFYGYPITDLAASDGYLDAGSAVLTINPNSVSSSMDVIGSIPGFTFDQFGMGTTTLLQNTLGVWELSPAIFLFQPPPTIPAGTYRFKFVTSYASTAGNLIGYGGSPAETLTVPVTSHAATPGSGPSTDLVVRFPTTGDYAFTFDERRQRFSILPAPAPASPFARR